MKHTVLAFGQIHYMRPPPSTWWQHVGEADKKSDEAHIEGHTRLRSVSVSQSDSCVCQTACHKVFKVITMYQVGVQRCCAGEASPDSGCLVIGLAAGPSSHVAAPEWMQQQRQQRRFGFNSTRSSTGVNATAHVAAPVWMQQHT